MISLRLSVCDPRRVRRGGAGMTTNADVTPDAGRTRSGCYAVRDRRYSARASVPGSVGGDLREFVYHERRFRERADRRPTVSGGGTARGTVKACDRTPRSGPNTVGPVIGDDWPAPGGRFGVDPFSKTPPSGVSGRSRRSVTTPDVARDCVPPRHREVLPGRRLESGVDRAVKPVLLRTEWCRPAGRGGGRGRVAIVVSPHRVRRCHPRPTVTAPRPTAGSTETAGEVGVPPAGGIDRRSGPVNRSLLGRWTLAGVLERTSGAGAKHPTVSAVRLTRSGGNSGRRGVCREPESQNRR